MSIIDQCRPTSEIAWLQRYPNVVVVDKPLLDGFKRVLHVTMDDLEIHDCFGYTMSTLDTGHMLKTAARIHMDAEFIKFLDTHGVPTGIYSIVNPLMYLGLKEAGQDVSKFTQSTNQRLAARPLSYNNVWVMPSLVGMYFWIN